MQEMTQDGWVYNVELLECGVWESVDTTTDLEEALCLAAGYCVDRDEDRVRIEMPGGWFF
jgi:hypothetical protein